jgi:high-affinity nickel permease
MRTVLTFILGRYPLGFLFGLGFDTSSEIALLILTATGGSSEESFGTHVLRSMISPPPPPLVLFSEVFFQKKDLKQESERAVESSAKPHLLKRSMILPLLFAAGMSLLDSLDGMMMLWIYG